MSLIGNLLACPACHTCFHHTIRELTELLHAVPMEFAGNTLLGRMTARALYYYYERADAQASAEALHANSPLSRRPTRLHHWSGKEIAIASKCLRREPADSHLGHRHAHAQEVFGAEANAGSKASSLKSSAMDAQADLAGMMALFELAKTSDACQLAWVARGLRACYALIVHARDDALKPWAEAALAERRPLLLLRLANHVSPLVCANAMQVSTSLSTLYACLFLPPSLYFPLINVSPPTPHSSCHAFRLHRKACLVENPHQTETCTAYTVYGPARGAEALCVASRPLPQRRRILGGAAGDAGAAVRNGYGRTRGRHAGGRRCQRRQHP